jgi:hypothetical protein
MALLALFAWQLTADVVTVVSSETEKPLAERIAQADLMRLPSGQPDGEAVQVAAEHGWYPSLRQPVFSWEEGLEGWQLEKGTSASIFRDEGEGTEEPEQAVEASALQLTQAQARHGRFSLQIPVHFPDAVTVHCPAQNLRGVRFIAYDVFLPAEARGYVGCLFFLKDKDGRWYQARSRAPMKAGTWTTVTADIRGGSPDVEPLGHTGQWDENQASQVVLIGITLHGDQPFQGTVLVDNFRGWLRAERFLQQTQPERLAALPEAQSRELAPFVDSARNREAEPVKFLNMTTLPSTAWGESGTLPRVGLYDSFIVRFDLNREVRNPFDPTEADIEAEIVTPSKKTFKTHAFWYQDFERSPRFAAESLVPVGRPEWRVRFSPREAGVHRIRLSIALDGSRQRVQGPELCFEATPSGHRGFVHVSKTNPYFLEYDNGEFFYPIGHNVHTPIDLRCWARIFKTDPPLLRGLTMYEDFFPKMAASGENTAEVWMASWWVGIEWTKRWPHFHGPGRYSLERAWLLDQVLEIARANGIQIHLVLDNHGKFSAWCDEEWAWNPYSRTSEPGGWLSEADAFFTDEKSREWYNRRLRYIAARWAGDTTIMGWEVVSEYDLTGSRSGSQFHRSEAGREWARVSAQALRALDPYERPIGNHYSTNYTRVDRELMDGPPFDYVATDAYRGGGGANDQSSCVSLAVETDKHFATYKRKPFWVTEYGGHWNGSTAAGLEADLHAGMWAGWLTHTVGTPLLWWYDVIDHRDLYGHFRGFANFIHGEDRRKLEGATLALSLQGTVAGLQGLQYRWTNGAYAWVYNAQALTEWPDEGSHPKHQDVKVSIPDLAAGAYRVEFWDTLTGQITGTQMKELKANEMLLLDLPPFEIDLAIKVKRHPDTPGVPGYQPPPDPVPFVEHGEKPPISPGTKKR